MPIRVVKDEQGKILYTIYKIRIVKFLDSRNKISRSDYLTSSFISQTVSSLINARLVDQYVVHDIAKSYSSLELAIRSISNEKGVCKYSANGRPYLSFSKGSISIDKTRAFINQGNVKYGTLSGNPFPFKDFSFKGISDPNKIWLDQYGAIAIQILFRDHQKGNQLLMISSRGFYSSKQLYNINLFEFFKFICLEPEHALDIAQGAAQSYAVYNYDVTLLDGINASYRYFTNKNYCPQV